MVNSDASQSADRAPLPVVVVTGFMGTGKTEVGKALADMLGLDFVDTDHAIEKVAGKSVSAIFDEHGEAFFRQMENDLCRELKGTVGVVIATGGGMLLNDENYWMLSAMGELVLLEASVDTLCERLSADATRPLLGSAGASTEDTPLRDRIEAILEERAPVYRRITLKFDTSQQEVNDTAAKIAAALELPSQSLSVRFSPETRETDDHAPAHPAMPGASHVEIGRGLLSKIGDRLQSLGVGAHAFFLVPEKLQQLFLPQLRYSMEQARISFDVITIEDGDSRKNIEQTRAIIDTLVERGAKRDSIVIPVGGGVTGDIGGFVASIYMRGVPLVQIPTTLLAQVDSSIGGKVGVNHPMAKNLIGSFHLPRLVVSDPCTLRSLPLEEISNGMAEVVKSALIGSEHFFAFLEEQTATDASSRLRDIDFLERCVAESSRIKAQVVNSDPFERDLRRTLNLGHTVGHAIEASSEYETVRHGQAVSMGTIAAMTIGVARGDIDSDLLERTSKLLQWCGLPIHFDSLDVDSLTRAIRLDKKIKSGRLHFVLLEGVGSPKIVDDVSVDEILKTIEGV